MTILNVKILLNKNISKSFTFSDTKIIVFIVKLPRDPEHQIDYFLAKTELNPKINCTWFGPHLPLVFVYHPDTVKTVIKSSGKFIIRIL